jgi:hypothetical protein
MQELCAPHDLFSFFLKTKLIQCKELFKRIPCISLGRIPFPNKNELSVCGRPQFD